MVENATYANYEKWLLENKTKVIEYVKQNDIAFRNIEISARAYNALRINGMHKFSDVILMTSEELNNLDMIDKTSVEEIRLFLRNYLRKQKKELINFVTGNTELEGIVTENRSIEAKEVVTATEQPNPANETSSQNLLYDIKLWLSDKSIKERIIEFVKVKNEEIKDFDISVRSYNALRRGSVKYLYEAISCYPDGFASFRNMGTKSIDEINGIIENYVSEHYDQITAYMSGEGIVLEEPKRIDAQQETDPFELTIPQLLNHPIFKEKTEDYIFQNNILIEDMGLSVRSTNALKRRGLSSFLDVVKSYPQNLTSTRNLGGKSIAEIKAKIESYIITMHPAVAAYCSGDTTLLYSDDFILETVISCFEDIGFVGVSFKEIIVKFPEDLDVTRVKKCIGTLLAENELEYVDFRLFRVYPSFYDVLEKSKLEFDEKDMMLKKFNGMTLEAIAKERGITRERVRQKIEKNLKKIKREYHVQTGFSVFDEDYYAYLYSNYEVNKELWLYYLGVSDMVFWYLVNTCSKGKTSIEEALTDTNVDLILKYKIQNYLNRNKIFINDVLVDRNRSSIEDYALPQICKDELSFEEFAEGYNKLLEENDIPFDDKIFYTEEVRRTRTNRLSDSMKCLWKHGERLRYYDIEGYDYTELLQTLHLESFENIEISTLKFMEDYPKVMDKYDIRDQYELHNLLKKIIDVNNYNNLVFHRQPMLQFGEFDRDEAIYNILQIVSPVTAEELAEYVHMEYGYDKLTSMWSYFKHLNQYYHNGVYSVDFKKIPENRIDVLMENLTEDFYFIADIKNTYKNLFGESNVDEINPLSLKSLGFTVLGTYVVKGFKSAEAYFTHLLTDSGVYDISKYNEKYNSITMYRQVYYALRQNYDFFLFDSNQAITMNRLSKLGITKDDITQFCDVVENFVNEQSYFTMHSLREMGFKSKLDELGFDDYFYANILAMDPRFAWQYVFGNIVLFSKTNQNDDTISKKSFLLYALSKHDSVDVDDFIADFLEEYGMEIPSRYEINRAIAGTEFYYDSIMDKVYRNKDIYYSEFDD